VPKFARPFKITEEKGKYSKQNLQISFSICPNHEGEIHFKGVDLLHQKFQISECDSNSLNVNTFINRIKFVFTILEEH
jgi:hypothetical protein